MKLLRTCFGNLWQRYFFHKALSQFLSLTGFLFFLYVLIDASVNYDELAKLPTWFDIIGHYLKQFVKRSPQLLPFALCLTSLKVFLEINQNHELTALLMGGFSRRQIISPLIRLGILCSLFIFLVFEGFLVPESVDLKNFNAAPFIKNPTQSLRTITLDDEHSRWLVYVNFEKEEQVFHQVFWIDGPDKVWHFDKLSLSESSGSHLATGHNADYFTRNDQKQLSWKDHQETLALQFDIDIEQLTQEARAPEELDIIELFDALNSPFLQIHRSEYMGYFTFRALQPTSCLLALLIPIPWCIRPRRRLSPFFIYCFSILSLCIYFIVLQSGLILSTSGRAHPFFSLVLPIFSCFGLLLLSINKK